MATLSLINIDELIAKVKTAGDDLIDDTKYGDIDRDKVTSAYDKADGMGDMLTTILTILADEKAKGIEGFTKVHYMKPMGEVETMSAGVSLLYPEQEPKAVGTATPYPFSNIK